MPSTPTGKTGYPKWTPSDPPKIAQYLDELGDHFNDLIGESVATAASLPASGNWLNREVMAEDTKIVYRCVSLPGTWVGVSGSGTDAAGWSWTVEGGKRTYRKYWGAWAGLAFGPTGGSNWQQARDAAVVVPTGRSWSDFVPHVDVWTADTTSNAAQSVIVGMIGDPTGTGNKSLLFANPSAVTIANTFMSLQASVTLVEK